MRRVRAKKRERVHGSLRLWSDEGSERSEIDIVADVVDDRVEPLGSQHRDLILIEIAIRRARHRDPSALAEYRAEIHIADRPA
jgi:hypothetical protein